MSAPATDRIFRDGFRIGELRGIQAKLESYRAYAPVGPEDKRGSGEILPFVRGLHFSAQIIYFIRSVLDAHGLKVHWGHVVHGSQIYCSPECDIIVHRNGSMHVWNGNVLDFHFVDLKQVVTVVSCKSIVASVDEAYCANLLKFGVPSVSLVGEFCSATNYANLEAKAKSAGYSGFWCLGVESEGKVTSDERILLNFIRFLEAIKP